MPKYQIDKDLILLSRIKYKRHSTLQRYLMNAFFKTTLIFNKPKAPIIRKVITIKAIDGTPIQCYFYHQGDKLDKPLLLYFHGGGFQMEGTFIHQGLIERFVLESNVNVMYVKYRLMPEVVFPKPFEDAIATYQYVKSHKNQYRVTDFYVAGDSAGGHLAYSLSLYDLREGNQLIKKTILIYPVLTYIHEFASHKMYTDTPMWNQSLNKAMWQQYLKQAKDKTYADLLSIDPKGLGKVYLETAEFDPLRDEGIALEHVLHESEVNVISYHTKYTVHGYDALPLAAITKEMMQHRIDFLKESL